MKARVIVAAVVVVVVGAGAWYLPYRSSERRFDTYIIQGEAPWCSVAKLRLPSDNDVYCRWLSERQCATEISPETRLCVPNPLR